MAKKKDKLFKLYAGNSFPYIIAFFSSFFIHIAMYLNYKPIYLIILGILGMTFSISSLGAVIFFMFYLLLAFLRGLYKIYKEGMK